MRKLLLILLTSLIVSETLKSKDIWIYSDDGAWSDGIIAIEQFLNHNGLTHKRIYAVDLNNHFDYSDAEAICFPGGFAYNYKVALSNKTITNLRQYVTDGGKYLGICAGAFFACSNVVWEGEEYPYQLALFEGDAVGSIYSIAKWDNYAMTNISINPNNPINSNQKSKLKTLYYGGPHFSSHKTKFDIIATYDSENNLPAIINFSYKKGKVLLIGPHLEIEEDSDRDSTKFAQELNDIESDWEMLGNLMQWLIGKETGIENKSNPSKYDIHQIYPNPANTTLFIKTENNNPLHYHITNSLGQVIQQANVNGYRIDVSGLQKGIYFIQLKNEKGQVFNSKFIKE